MMSCLIICMNMLLKSSLTTCVNIGKRGTCLRLGSSAWIFSLSLSVAIYIFIYGATRLSDFEHKTMRFMLSAEIRTSV